MRYLLLITLLVSSLSKAQTILLMHDVNKDVDTEEGPGKPSFSSVAITLGFMGGPAESDSLGIRMGRSFEMGYGAYVKGQYGKFFGLGLQNGFLFKSYSIDQSKELNINGSYDYEKERIWQLGYEFLPFIRLTYVLKRGDHHGIYTDLGFSGVYNFMNRHVYRASLDPSISQEGSVKVVSRKLQYMRRLDYGPVFRFGIRNIEVYVKYRLSDLFKEHNNYLNPELPRFSAGFMIGM